MATVSNVRVSWKPPDSSHQPRVGVESLPFPAVILDATGLVAAANQEWLDLYPSTQPGMALPDLLTALNPGSAESREALREGIQDLLGGSGRRFVQQSEKLRFHVTGCSDGALMVREELPPPSAAPATREDENVSRAQKMESVGRLVGGVVHDFANLLTLISGYSEILLNRIGEKDPLRPELDEIRRAANRGARLTGQILGFTRGQRAEPKAIDLNALITEMQRMLRPIIGEYVELQTSLAQNLGKVVADPGQMEQVIMNLILNARDALPGGGRIRIETGNCDPVQQPEGHLARRTACVMLTISDNGSGIPPDALPHVFEPFYTTKEKGKGTGLGLSTVHRIVKESGGDIGVRSTPGEGTAFSICLPCAQQPAESGDVSAGVRTVAAGNETVLLVEDEEGVRRLLVHVLRKHGYHVLEACDGEQALHIFDEKASEIHLVLTDMVMPGMSGRTLAERIREIRPETRIVFMSGYTDDVLVRTGALGPGMSFLQKPLRPEVLAAKVREALDSPGRPFNPR